MPLFGASMITVAQYREFATQCREMATRTHSPLDRKALELQAAAWDRIANERETALTKEPAPKAPPGP